MRIYWEQSCPMNHGIKPVCLSIRLELESDEPMQPDFNDQIKAAYIGSISQSATLVELVTGQNSTADHTFTKMIDEISGLSISQLT